MGGASFLFALVMLFAAQGAGSNQTDSAFHVGELEIVNVTDSGFALAWYSANPTRTYDKGRPLPVPADTVVRYGTSPDPSTWTTVTLPGSTAYHYVEIEGLTPDTPYWVEASSNGIRAVNVSFGKKTVRSPVQLRTLSRPAGERVARLVIANDTHVGESISGEAVRGWPPGFRVDPANPYWRNSTTDLVEEATEAAADALIVNGDLTAEARPAEIDELFDILDGFAGPVLVNRGNHDRAHAGPDWESCSPVPASPEYHDCLTDRLGLPAGSPVNWVRDIGPVVLVGIQSSNLLTGYGEISADTAAFLDAALAGTPGKPALVFLHHPATWQSVHNWVVWPGFMLPPVDLARLQGVLAAHDNVTAVFSGHTHRNYRSASPTVDGVLFQEIGAAKEHMSGYGILDVYEDGLVYRFQKLDCADCLVWAERTRHQYFGLYGHVVQGTLSDRAFTYFFDAA
ncbi:MAG: metallophosphoesterase family protein [Acidimicrobiia bacterium]|nr:metallophosphoesterase family protein [Acidimicrobiia bacterium]